jgi:S1-C subfamily serine protease
MTSVHDKIRESVIKVFTQSDAPDYDQPWQTQGVDSSVGSGLIVRTKRGPRVLTNAHVVENQVFIEVRRYGRARKCLAKVEGVGHACDLALLTVEDSSLFTDAEPIRVGKLPMLGKQVTVLGYPIGGDRLSLTQGVVSRIEMSPYAHSQRRLLTVQIDAAINAGNSGGPAVNERGELVGVSFEALDEGENIGYLIGAPVVRHFLRDMDSGSFDGFPDLGVVTQNLASATHRRFLGLSPRRHGGVLIANVVHGGSAWGCLERGDVLYKLGASRVASDGTIPFRKGERVHFSHLVAQCQIGERMQVQFWRDGAMRRRAIRLKRPQYLVPEDRYDLKPTYYLYGGLLFVPLSRDYFKTWGSDWWDSAPSALTAIYEDGIRTPARSEVVVLQKVLADRVNQGYQAYENLVVSRIQGRKIRHLRDLVRTLERSKAEFVRVDLQDGRTIVLDRALAGKRHAGILRRFGIPKDRSEDLRADGKK